MSQCFRSIYDHINTAHCLHRKSHIAATNTDPPSPCCAVPNALLGVPPALSIPAVNYPDGRPPLRPSTRPAGRRRHAQWLEAACRHYTGSIKGCACPLHISTLAPPRSSDCPAEDSSSSSSSSSLYYLPVSSPSRSSSSPYSCVSVHISQSIFAIGKYIPVVRRGRP
jgi:hypothetical protein